MKEEIEKVEQSLEAVKNTAIEAQEGAKVVAEQATQVLDKTNDVVAFTFDKMEGYFGAAQKIIEQYGGDVAALGLNVLRIEAISELIPYLIYTILSVLFYKGALSLSKKIEEDNWDGDTVMFVFLGYITSCCLAVVAVIGIFNLWAWVGMFWPELYAVHKFLL